jgi:Tfp pilus assembly protein PilF
MEKLKHFPCRETQAGTYKCGDSLTQSRAQRISAAQGSGANALRRRKAHALLLQSVLLAGFAGVPVIAHPAMAQGDAGAIHTLLERAKYLEAHGHPDIAAQAWQQVLLSDPQNREALAGLAKADMQLGRTEDARGYLDRLKAIGGNSADVQAIENMPVVKSRDARLDAAVRAARAGDYAGAVRIYQQVFGDTPPPGNWALAYYDTEAALPDRREDAIDGLRKLAQQFPAESRYSITLGRILTYDAKTRPQGIALLSRYGESQQAQNALQQAERWNASQQTGLQQGPAPRGPQDAGGRPERAAAGAPAGNSHDALGYRALNSGHLDEAEREFRASLAASPKSPQALSGLGYVRMKQHAFADAQSYLDQARASGATGKGFEEALGLAHFWTTMNRAADEQKAGNLQQALADFRQAQQMRAGSAEAAEGAAGVLMQQGDSASAEVLYQDALKEAPRGGPSQAEAWLGLVLAQAGSGDAAAALQTASRVPASLQGTLQTDPAYLGALYRASLAAGDKARASQLLSQVLALPFPNHGRDLPISRQMQYADLLAAAQKYNAALSLYRQIVAQDPENEQAWRAMIATEHSMGNDEEALVLVQQIPAQTLQKLEARSEFLALIGSLYSGLGETGRAQQYLQRALSTGEAQGGNQTGMMLQLAGIDAQRGDLEHAYDLYSRVLAQNGRDRAAWAGLINTLHLEHRDREALQKVAAMDEDTRLSLDGDVNFLQVLASVQTSTGSPRLAMATLRQLQQMYNERNQPVPVAAQIQYAWLLNAAGDDRTLYPLVQKLAATPDMTPTEQGNFRAMVAAWTVRRGNADIAAGRQGRGLQLLAAAHQTFPENEDISGSLAGAYLRVGQPRQALALYEATGMQDATLPQYRGAIAAALAAGDTRAAADWLEAALPRYGTDPNLLRMAAQYEQARGDSRKAAAYYKAALQMMGSGSAIDGNGGITPGTQNAGGALLELLAPEAASSGRGNGNLGNGSYGYGNSGNSQGGDPNQYQNGGQSGERNLAPNTGVPQQQTLGDLLGPDANAARPFSDRERGSEAGSGMESGSLADADAGAPALPVPESENEAPNPQGPQEAMNLDQPANLSGDEATDRSGNPSGELSEQNLQPPPSMRSADRASDLGSDSGSDAVANVDNLQFSADGAANRTEPNGRERGTVSRYERAAESPRLRRLSQPDALPEQASDPSGYEIAAAAPAQQSESDAVPASFAPVAVQGEAVGASLRPVAEGFDAGQTTDGGEDAGRLEQAARALQQQNSANGRRSRAAEGHVQALPRLSAPGRGATHVEGEAQDPSLSQGPMQGALPSPGGSAQGAGTVFSPASRDSGQFAGQVGVSPMPDSPGAGFVASLPPIVGSFQNNKTALTPRDQVEEQLEVIQSGESGWVGGTSSINHRSGQAGLDQLSVYSAQIESSAMLGPDARLSVITEPVLLDAGTATGTATVPQGTLPLTATPQDQTASGVGGELQLRTANFGASIGYTPYNFLISNAIGSVLVHPASGHFTLSLSRSPVEDTQLSYAGLRDTGSEGPLYSGNIWGGVISDAGELQIASGNAVQGWYIEGGGQYVTGYHVPDNKRIDGDAGAYWKVWQSPDYGSITVGANFFGMHYTENLRYFTYGQGGYFSPSAYLLGNVPITVNGHYGNRLHYQVEGSLGVQAFSEDSSAYYPLDLATQIAAGNPYYPGQTSVGSNYDLQAQGAYAITDHWYVGAYFDANNSRDYASTRGGFSVRYLFRPQPALGDRGPTGLFPAAGMRPLKVP